MKKLVNKITDFLQKFAAYPLETRVSSNTFVWSFFINLLAIIGIVVYTHFNGGRSLRGTLIGWEIGISEVFAIAMSFINYFKYKKFCKEYEEHRDQYTKEDLEESNSSVGFVWYWIAGTVVAYLVAMLGLLVF